MLKKSFLVCFLIISMVFSFQVHSAQAQSSNDNLSPKTQQYIDNLNEVKEAQNDNKPVNTYTASANQGTSIWTYVFYGAISGAAYAFWRWVRKLRSRD